MSFKNQLTSSAQNLCRDDS